MRKTRILACAIALAALHAVSAGAQTLVNANVVADTTWGAGAFPCPIVMDRPIFVTNGATLTILPNCIVRGQPRSAAVQPGVIAGTPGTLIVTQSGQIQAVGDANNPITFTSAAVDNDQDGVPDDDDNNGFLDAWVPGDLFLDFDPIGSPLSPLNAAGGSNVQLWGGLVLLGNAPTNLGVAAGVGFGKGLIEGLQVPGFPAADATYGGSQPHDSSGRIAFASIRYAGDEIGAGNELNCASLGGVGDGTQISHVECMSNQDDGFEMFGGTVNLDHIVTAYIGDDSIDVDQGYQGTIQFGLVVMPTFNQNNGAAFGAASGDKAGEWDGDDNGNANTRIDNAGAAVDATCWPIEATDAYNLTVFGSTPDGANPAVSPAADNRGIQMRNGFAGKLINSIVVNTGTQAGLDVDAGGACANSTIAANLANGLIASVATTYDDVAAMGADENTAIATGNALAPLLGAPPAPTSSNVVNPAFGFALVNETTAVLPTGVAGHMPPASAGVVLPGGPTNPEAAPGSFTGVAGGVPGNPGAGLDPTATYRGGFEAGAPNWTTGWTSLNQAGILAN